MATKTMTPAEQAQRDKAIVDALIDWRVYAGPTSHASSAQALRADLDQAPLPDGRTVGVGGHTLLNPVVRDRILAELHQADYDLDTLRRRPAQPIVAKPSSSDF